MAKPYLKLQVNLPISGTVKAAYLNVGKPIPGKPGEKFGDQIALLGVWDGQEAYLPVPIGMESELRALQVLGPPVSDKYPVLYTGTLTFTKKEQGTKRYTEVSRADGSVAAPPVGPTAKQSPPQSVQPAAPSGTDRGFWLALKSTYEACLKLSVDAWKTCSDNRPFSAEVVAAGAHTMFIMADKHGQLVIPKKERTIEDFDPNEEE